MMKNWLKMIIIGLAGVLLTSCASVPVSGYLTAFDDTDAVATAITEEIQTDTVETYMDDTDSNYVQMESIQKEQPETADETSHAMYTAYAQIIEEYEQDYGEGAYAVNGYYGYRLSGLFLAQLLDFDGDGQHVGRDKSCAECRRIVS